MRQASCFLPILFCFLWAAGCASVAPVDQWEIFRPDYDKALEKAQARQIQKPSDVLPEMDGTPVRASDPTPKQITDLAPDGEPLSLSVEAAVLMALRFNQELRVQQLNPVIAGTFEKIERGVFDPEVFAAMEYERLRALQTSRATEAQFGVKGSDVSYAAGIRQSLPTGTELEATVRQERSRSNRSPEQQTARLGLSVTQSLLRGLGPAVNLARVRQAGLGHTASLYELRGFTESLVADTEIAYWRYVVAAREIAIFENALEVAKEQRDAIEQKIRVGLLPRTEAAAARAEVALREQALIDAQSQLEKRRLRFVRLIAPGSEGQADLEIRPATQPEISPQPIKDLDERVRLAEQSRPDVNESRLRLQQDRLELITTRNGLLPRLELFAALGRSGYADSFSGSFSELDANTHDLSAGFRFSHFLGGRTAEARDLAARATRRQSGAALSNLLRIVRLDVRLAANEVARARRQISATAATRALQEQSLRAEEERFEVGDSTSLLVAQAQRDLLAARLAEVEAIVNYRIALVELFLAEGSLLERRGIAMGPGSG